MLQHLGNDSRAFLEQNWERLGGVDLDYFDYNETRGKMSVVGHLFVRRLQHRVTTDKHPGDKSSRKSISHNMKESVSKTRELEPA